MKRLLIIFLFQTAMSTLYAQFYDNKWLTGYDDVRYILFDSDTPKTELRYMHWTLSGYNDTFASLTSKSNICDESGEMLIVANSNGIGNNYGLYIENGKHLLDSIHEYNSPFGDVIYQQCLLLPKVANQYYFINSTITDSAFIQFYLGWPDSSYLRYPARLNHYYSVVDMDANDGLGKVVSKKNVLFHDSRVTDGLLTAVRHANGIDWWVVFANIDTGKLYTFLFTPEGVEGPLIQKIGQPMKRFYGTATAVFSPDGTMIAMGTPLTTISLLDFDRCTGLYSNQRNITSDSSGGGFAEPISGLSGLAFSSNNKYLYMCGGNDAIAQYNLDSADISASFRLIYKKNPITDPPDMSIFYMALAPDNKIYVSNFGGSNKFLHCITAPNRYDTACAFRIDYLQTTDYGGSICPTNMPNYRAKALAVYTLNAGHDTVLCKGDSVVLGIEPFKYLAQTGKLDSLLHLEWSASSSLLNLDATNKYHPILKVKHPGYYEVYLSLHDTITGYSCTDRIDTVSITVIDCDTLIPSTAKFIIPTIWDRNDGTFTIIGLPEGAVFSIYNTIGQLIFNQNNYANNWNTGLVSDGMYIYRLKLKDGKELKGKIFVY